MKDGKLFHRVTPLVIFSRVAAPLVKILPMVFTRWNKFPSFTEKQHIFCLFHAFNPFWKELYQNPVQFFSLIPCGVPLLHNNALQYYVKREKCKVNDVVFLPGFEARAINLGNKNMKIGIFTGGTSIISKNIFTAISRYPTGKHEIKSYTSIMHKTCQRQKLSTHFSLRSWHRSILFADHGSIFAKHKLRY